MAFLRKNLEYFFIFVLFVCAIFVWYAVFCESRSGLEADFLDVGQGDSVFLQAKNGSQVLLDGGPDKTVLRRLGEVMPFYDRSIDALILSHPHADHLDGLIEVLERYEVEMVIEPCLDTGEADYKEWENLIEEKNIKRICAKAGERVNLGDGAYFDILLPVGGVEERSPHEAMLVSRFVYGKNSFMLTGDMESSLENYLVYTERGNLKSDVLKVGHHGSDTSTSESFLGYVSPEYAVISVGEDNKFGHPRREVLDRLNRFGASIFRTDEDGTVKIFSDGEKISVKN